MPAPDERTSRLAPAAAGVLAWVERAAGITPTGVAVIVGAAVVWLIAFRLGSRVLLLMVYGILVLLAALIALGRRRPALQAERSRLPVRIREGQTVAAEVTITSPRRRTALVLEEMQHPLVGPPVRILVASLAAGESVSHAYTVSPSLRGVYEIGPLTAIWTDPFGLTRNRARILPAARVIVHPNVERVEDRILSREWEDPPIRPPVSKPWPHGFEFYGMRDYVPGDDPRRIVWSAVARTGRYLVREAEQGITDRVTILLDTDRGVHLPGDPSETFETAIRATASLAVHHLKEGFVVGVESPEGTVARVMRGPSKRIEMLDAMARAVRGDRTLTDGLARVLSAPQRDAHLILVTPHLEHAAARMVRLLLDRGGSMTFVHLVTEESDPRSLLRAAALGCEIVELRVGAPLDAVFRRSVGAGMRR